MLRCCLRRQAAPHAPLPPAPPSLARPPKGGCRRRLLLRVRADNLLERMVELIEVLRRHRLCRGGGREPGWGLLLHPREEARRREVTGRRGENTAVERTRTVADTRKGGREKGGGEAAGGEAAPHEGREDAG
jgi:hypothetical protein